jgi:hypothetical protein
VRAVLRGPTRRDPERIVAPATIPRLRSGSRVHQPTRVYTLTPDCPGGQPAAPPGIADELNPGAVSAEMRNVVIVVNDARTQNGHIRNDTRDVSRRLSRAEIGPFCRGKCVANDRPCTRLTLSDFHGKEGVDGSSPSEGSTLREAPANRLVLLS